MLTEEKLQNFLDDLRLGKYDNERYEITTGYEAICIKDLHNNTNTWICVGKKSSKKYLDADRKWRKSKIKKFFCKAPNFEDYPFIYIAIVEGLEEECEISESLYKSFISYISELTEKDKLVKRSNIESSFGL